MLKRQGTFQPAALLAVLISATVLQGCVRDPNVKKARYLKSGEHYAAEGKQQEAIIQFANAIKIDPNYAAAHYDLAKAYMKLDAFAGAFTELQHTVALDPHNIQARMDIGDLLLAAHQYAASKDQANAILALQPNNANAMVLLSNIALGQGNTAEALQQVKRALTIDPNNSNFHAALGLIELRDPTQRQAAEDELQKAIALDPRNAAAHSVLSGVLAQQGDMQGAEQQSRTAVHLAPTNIRFRLALAAIEIHNGNQAAAEATLQQGTELLSDNQQGADLLWNYYSDTHQVDKASSVYAALVARHPGSVPLKVTYAHILIQQQKFAQARSIADQLMKSSSNNPDVAILNAMLLLQAGQAENAFLALQKEETNWPDNVSIKIWLGQAALAKGDLPDAEQSFQAAARLQPGNIAAETGLATVANQLGDFNLLTQVATNTLAVYPNSSQAYLWKAMAEAHQQQTDEAAADLQTAIAKDPANVPAIQELGALRMSQNKIPEGEKLLEQALTADPNDVAALGILVGYDVHQNQIPQALALVQQQIAKAPSNSQMYDLLSEVQMTAKDASGAAASAQKAMQLNPSDGAAISNYTRAEVSQGNPQAALASWKNWTAAHPDQAHGYTVLGALEEALANPDAAEAYYKKALAIDSNQPTAANNLAYLMMQRGQAIDVALSLAEIAHRGMPNSPATSDTLAWAYYLKGTYGSARDLLETAVKTDPDDASIQYHLGMIDSKLGNKADALAHLKKASTLAPDTQIGKSADLALHAIG